MAQTIEDSAASTSASRQDSPVHETGNMEISSDTKKGEMVTIDVADPEVAQVKETYYSKVSVYLMMLFSALAMGSDGYNAAIIGNASLLFAVLYPDALTDAMYSRLSNAFLIGMIVGMLGLGYIVDRQGRKTGAVMTTLLLTVGIALSTGAAGTSPTGMLWMLVIARGLTGVGAGGEYPVTGAVSIEATDESAHFRKRRGFILAIVGEVSASLGYCWGALVPLLLLLITKQRESQYELVWRLSFALGVIPPLSIFYFRMRMAVSTSYRKSALRKQKIPYFLMFKLYWRRILAAGFTWGLYNWVSIPFGIFSSTIISRVNPDDSLVKNLGWGVLINSFYLPGPFLGGWLADKIGRRQTMTLGFAVQGLLGFVIGGAIGPIQNIFPLFVVLYGVFLTLGEVGPGATISVVSTEPFPTSVRGHLNGLVSAIAKAGAAIGTQVFTVILNSWSDPDKANRATFLIGSAISILGAVIAWFMLEDVSRELDFEDQRWKNYLIDNGWEASWGDQETKDPAGVFKHTLTPTS